MVHRLAFTEIELEDASLPVLEKPNEVRVSMGQTTSPRCKVTRLPLLLAQLLGDSFPAGLRYPLRLRDFRLGLSQSFRV